MAANPPDIEQTNVEFVEAQASPVVLLFARREMTIYALNESEVRSISFMNTLAMAFFSLASACLTFALGVWVEGAFQENLSAEATVLNAMAPPICAVGTIVFAGLGIWALMHRGSMLKTVRSESHVESQSGD